MTLRCLFTWLIAADNHDRGGRGPAHHGVTRHGWRSLLRVRERRASLASFASGDVLRTRTLLYHLVGVPMPVTATQSLYRTSDALGQPAIGVVSVLRSPVGDGRKAVSHQSAYDSLSPEDAPSRAIAGDVRLGGAIPHVESLLLVPLLLTGYDVVIADTEGQSADFAVGPEYGAITLDAIRAAIASPGTGITPTPDSG
ncbi:hypothetical protein GCM10010493_78940 [Streptomyces lavendulae subsp. grasserius]